MDEEWRDIAEYEGKYQISNYGRVRSLSRLVRKLHGLRNLCGRILTPTRSGFYMAIMFGDRRKQLVHRLVARAFIPNPQLKPCVNHINGDKYNNHISNLEWVTYSENEIHSYKVLNKQGSKPWLGKRGRLNPTSKPVDQFDMNGNFIQSHESSQLAVEFLRSNGYPRATQGSLGCALRGKYHYAYGHKWKYQGAYPGDQGATMGSSY